MAISTYNVGKVWPMWVEASRRQIAALDSGDKKKIGKACRDWYLMTGCLLRAYCGGSNWPGGTEAAPRESIPVAFARVLANQFGYLAKGEIPQPMLSAAKRGRHAAGPHEQKDMGIAVAYIKAARQRAIADPKPLHTIAKNYAISLDTVKRWQRELGWVSPRDFFANAPEAKHGTMLTEGMRTAGARYRVAGRSSAAVRNRQKKRKADK